MKYDLVYAYFSSNYLLRSCFPPKFMNFSLKLPSPVSDALKCMSVSSFTARKM